MTMFNSCSVLRMCLGIFGARKQAMLLCSREESERGEERGRSKGRSQVVSQRSQSSRGERRRVYFGGSPVEESPRLAPSYTIYKEGGQGFTKYTVYAKQQQEQERKGMMNRKLPSVKRAVPTTRPMEVQGKSSKRERVCRYMPFIILHGSDIILAETHPAVPYTCQKNTHPD